MAWGSFNRQPKPCPDCNASGAVDGRPCKRCKMRGQIWPARITTKYGRTNCNGGCGASKLGGSKGHHSKEEARYCDKLALLVKAGRIKSYRGQVRYDIRDRMGVSCGYLLVDFEVLSQDDIISIHEYKGSGFMNTPEFRHKRALFTWCYPHIVYNTVGIKDIVLL